MHLMLFPPFLQSLRKATRTKWSWLTPTWFGILFVAPCNSHRKPGFGCLFTTEASLGSPFAPTASSSYESSVTRDTCRPMTNLKTQMAVSFSPKCPPKCKAGIYTRPTRRMSTTAPSSCDDPDVRWLIYHGRYREELGVCYSIGGFQDSKVVGAVSN